MYRISGTYCASLTPFMEDYSINKKLLLDHCNNLLSQNVDGIAIFGTTGEANSLSIEEKLDAINFLIDNKIDSKKLLPGTGLNSIKDTVIFTKAVAKINVKAVLVLPPTYYKNISSEGLIDYYVRVIEEVGETNLHYLLYHFPQMSNVNIDLNVIEKLLYKYQNLCETNDPYVFNESIDKKYLDLKEINKRIKSGADIIGREDKYKKIELDNTFPSFILNNVSEFKDWIA